MYSLDINFLHDRPEYAKSEVRLPTKKAAQNIDQTPILIGVGVALGINALVGGVWFVLDRHNAQLAQESAALDQTLQDKNNLAQAVDQIYAEAKQANEEALALATVFNEIKPWSALSLELGGLMQTAGVKITDIKQTEPEPTVQAAAPAKGEEAAKDAKAKDAKDAKAASAQPATPAPEVATAKIEIVGVANSFTQINDFILLLNQSPFFNSKKTKLVAANLQDNPTQLVIRNEETAGTSEKPELQSVVKYTIETQLSSAKASELLPQLTSGGAIGLVNRIQTLREKGVIQ